METIGAMVTIVAVVKTIVTIVAIETTVTHKMFKLLTTHWFLFVRQYHIIISILYSTYV